MVKIDGYDIQLSRGDNLFLRIDLEGRDLPDGTEAVFSVKKNVKNDEILIQKRVNASAEVASILLSSRETALPPGVYYWDLRLLVPLPSGGYGVETPMDYAAFVVTEVVGDRIADGTDFEEIPELPIVQTLLAEMRLAIQNANEAVVRVEEAARSHAPYIGDNQNWWLWNSQTGAYEDSGIAAVVQPDDMELTDAKKLGGKAPEYYLQPRNLLDNSCFERMAEIVNQRGQTTYSAVGYTIDRWVIQNSGSVITVGSAGVQAGTSGTTKYLYQRLHLTEGKTYTLAACTTDDVLYVITAVYTAATSWTWIKEGSAGGKIALGLANSGQGYACAAFSNLTSNAYTKWIALYEGSYTAETLPPYVPKGYAVELAECQRYFRKYTHVSISGDPTSERYLPMSITYPKMRTVPSVSFQSILTSASSATDAVFERAQASTDSLLMIVLVEGKSSAKYVYGLELNADL